MLVKRTLRPRNKKAQIRDYEYLSIAGHGGTPASILLILPVMGQKKLIRFEAIKHFPNVLQYPEGMAGKWAEFYKNDHPLTLELACGKGEYTVGLGQMYP